MLLLHGFGDTPQTLTGIARHIHSAGFRVHAPLYPGHGSTTEEFFTSRAEDWMRAAREAFDRLRAVCESVSIVGLSMGAATGAVLAAECDGIKSLVFLAPYLRIPTWVRLALTTRRLWEGAAGPISARHPESIQDPLERERSLAYGVVDARVMSELARMVKLGWNALPKVMAPTLVIQSRHDPRVSAASAIAVERRLGAREKSLVWTESGGHVITVDYGREKVFGETLTWISRWSGQPPRQ